MNKSKGFTLIELLVVISIISLLSSIVATSLSVARKKARDSQRIQNARQIANALEQYEHTNNTYKISNAGYNNSGTGFVSKSGGGGYTTSIMSALKNQGFINTTNLSDPIYGLDNYYIGLCTSTNAYNVFVKLEQSEYNNATSSIANACGGIEASSLGFSYIGATTGGTSGGGAGSIAGSYEEGFNPGGGGGFVCGDTVMGSGSDTNTYGTILAEDNRCWLDRNLGATQVATAYNDHLSYGSKYQWGRGSDGHQLISYTSATVGAGITGVTSTPSESSDPGHNKFITTNTPPYHWTVSPLPDLDGNNDWPVLNNPCPLGFHVPTYQEWDVWSAAANVVTASCGGTSTCINAAYNSSLKLSAGNTRDSYDAILRWLGSYGYYWSSTGSYSMSFRSNAANPASIISRANGLSVRCIKD